MPKLVLIRHGTTQWGEENRFAGWGDAALSSNGAKEARQAGRALAKSGLVFDHCYTSLLTRAQQTLDIVVEKMHLENVPVSREWRLNERHYGALQGETRGAMIGRHGNSKVVEWRRSFSAVPPPFPADDPRWLEQLVRLPGVPSALQPRTESMAAAADRVVPLWEEKIAPELRAGKHLLVVAHTSSVRGLVRLIEGLSDADCANFRIATAVPRLYVLNDELEPLQKLDITRNVNSTLRYWVNWLKPRRLGWA
jgi:2,3-bisphosphoglycerate-dependent phosphoglycerate mutase